ncbi:CG14958, partial [Drosophila busckii]
MLFCLAGHTAWAACNVCQSNQVACMNSTSFYLCFGEGTPNTDNLYSCLAGFQCSDRAAICIQKNAQVPPSCGDTSKCGQCSAHRNFKFACHSRGIFQMCVGAAQPTGVYGECPSGKVCDANSDEVCVPEVPGQVLTCNVN